MTTQVHILRRKDEALITSRVLASTHSLSLSVTDHGAAGAHLYSYEFPSGVIVPPGERVTIIIEVSK